MFGSAMSHIIEQFLVIEAVFLQPVLQCARRTIVNAGDLLELPAVAGQLGVDGCPEAAHEVRLVAELLHQGVGSLK